MSMQAISASFLVELGKEMGIYDQLELDLEPYLVIKPEYLVSLPKELKYAISSTFSGSLGIEYHPSYMALREWLDKGGYIKTQTWHNGDVVTKPFYLNDVYFSIGDRFLSPEPLKRVLERKISIG